MFRKGMTWLALVTLLLTLTSFTGMAESEAATPMTPGTYVSTVSAMNGDMEVTVELGKDSILSVKVTKEQETLGIGSPLKDKDGNLLPSAGLAPVESIPAAIVEGQTLDVDSVSGATITSVMIVNAVSNCIKEAGGDPNEWKREVSDTKAAADASADVVVVGGGGAGLAAAVSAAQNGASVILVEKNGAVGGNTLVCAGGYNAPHEEKQANLPMNRANYPRVEAALSEEPVSEEHAAIQAIIKEQWDAYLASGSESTFDSSEWYALQTWNGGDKLADLDLVLTLTRNSNAGYKWLESMGMEFTDTTSESGGSLWPRAHAAVMRMGSGYIATLVGELDKYDNVSILTDSKATHLLMDGNRVTGVVCENPDGETFNVTATDGVVLATGGFAANTKMLQEYNTTGKWPDLSKVTTTNRYSVGQGDGITLGLEAGASLTDMDQIQLLYQGNTRDGLMTRYWSRPFYNFAQLFWVNVNGERFVAEDARRDVLCTAILQQPEQRFYYIESADGVDFQDPRDLDWRSADGLTWDYLESNGYGYIADTPAELAEKLGIDPEVFLKTVEEFNEAVDAGVDSLGRTLYSVKLEHGPWMAMPRKVSAHYTMGGLTIDTQAHVLNDNGEPIPGLYAAGEVTGGIQGTNRIAGNAVTDIIVFGRIAGESAVSDAK